MALSSGKRYEDPDLSLDVPLRVVNVARYSTTYLVDISTAGRTGPYERPNSLLSKRTMTPNKLTIYCVRPVHLGISPAMIPGGEDGSVTFESTFGLCLASPPGAREMP